jgi:hypothetical protein
MITSSVLMLLKGPTHTYLGTLSISAEIRPMKKVHRSPCTVSLLYRLSVHPRGGNATRISANQDSLGSPTFPVKSLGSLYSVNHQLRMS